MVIIPAMLLVLYLVKGILKEAFKEEKKKAALAAASVGSGNLINNPEPVGNFNVEIANQQCQ